MNSKLFPDLKLPIMNLAELHLRWLQNTPTSLQEVPLHEILISVGACLLLILAILVYRQHQLDHRRVEFTVFNSQYLGKESTRSNSEHDFPNFDTEIKVRQDNS